MRCAKLVPVVLAVFLLSLVVFAVPAFAATTATVTINATPAYVGISVNNSSYDFSTVVADTDENTPQGYFGITNASTVSTDNTVVSDGWNSSGSAWTWGAPGENTAQMKASDGDGAYDVTIDDVTPVNLSSYLQASFYLTALISL